MLLPLFCYGQQQQPPNLESNIKLLFASNTFDVRDKPFFFNGNNLLIIDDRKMFILPVKDTTEALYAGFLPDNIHNVEQVAYSGGNIFIKNESNIIQLKDTTASLFMKMPNENFSIYPADEKSLFVVINQSNNFELFRIDAATGNPTKLISSPEQITNVIGSSDKTIISIGNDIFLLQDEKTVLIHHNKTPIKSLTGSEYGLFIASEEGLSYLCLPFLVVPVIKEDTQKVVCAGNIVIVLLKDGRVLEIDNANSFENRIRAFVNK